MINKAIQIQNLSKRYLIGKKKDGSLRGTLNSLFTKKKKVEEFWALKDFNLDIEHGEVLGVIGKNGAGKSTLLKLLSQITFPTSGRIEINGRVASLLEVGTGFHPELTGRENIFLNGTILGMTRKEVAGKFDEIVEFSGIEKFIDTPVKRYSSGMYVRLAFAVAAHLEPEILIVDEVLAVGDASFQKKCLGKMKEVAQAGRTVIFVSHDIEAVSSFCTRGVLLDKGQISAVGNIHDVIAKYTNEFQTSAESWEGNKRPGDDTVKLNSVCVVDKNENQISRCKPQDEIGVIVSFEVLEEGAKPAPNLHFFTGTNTLAFVAISEVEALSVGTYETKIWVPKNVLNNAVYRIGVASTTLKNMNIHFYEKEVISIEVVENKIHRESEFGGRIPGVVRPKFKTTTTKINHA